MKKQSDDVFERVNERALRLDPKAKSFRLTGFHWRDAPRLMLGLAASFILLAGINLAYAAVFEKDLLFDKERPDPQEEFQVVQEGVALGEAVTQAMREGDQDATQRCRKKFDEFMERHKARQVREAQRVVEHANAEKALRKRYGAAALGLIVAGLSLALFSRSRVGRGQRGSA